MLITILSVGKIKERYWTEAIREYTKRLGRYCRLELLEVEDEQTPDNAGEALEAQIKQKEGLRLLRQIRDGAYVIALAIDGKRMSSEQFAGRLETLAVQGKSQIVFVIGGSLGLSEEVLRRADERLSFSDLTFPHQMMRVILLEQIYRCFRIIRHEPYHK